VLTNKQFKGRLPYFLMVQLELNHMQYVLPLHIPEGASKNPLYNPPSQHYHSSCAKFQSRARRHVAFSFT